MREEIIKGGNESGDWMSCERFCDMTGLDATKAAQYADEGKIKRDGNRYSYDSYMVYLGVLPKKRKGHKS